MSWERGSDREENVDNQNLREGMHEEPCEDGYGKLVEERYPEVEGFDQLCANLKSRVVAHHEGDLKLVQRLYRGIVVMAYKQAKEKLLTRKPPDVADSTDLETAEWRSPEWKRFRFNLGDISRLMRKWRGITFKEIRQNSLNSKLKIPYKKLTETSENW